MMPGLESNLLRELDALIREINTIYEVKFKKYALQKGQFVYLTRICETPGINLVELSYQLKIDKTTTTKAVQKLVNAGLVVKQQDASDKRIWHLNPTVNAQHVYAEIIAEKNRVFNCCLAGISRTEIEGMRQLIEKMALNISHDWHQAARR
jgi:DNA-binding MarR family transcriptional regulator